MKKWLKIVLLIWVCLVVIAGVGILTFQSGALVRPSANALSAMSEVEAFDILAWQAQREQDILADYNAGSYTFNDPYVIVDPYDMNPLSALVIFDAVNTGDIAVTVVGEDDYSTISYVKSNNGERIEVPVLGLYAGKENIVLLEDAQGNQKQLMILTEPLPVDFQTYTLEESIPEMMEPGITLFTVCFEHSYTALVDNNGAVRGYLSNQGMGHGTSMNVLQNGRMLATGDEYRIIPYNMMTVWEFNWLGKIFSEYQVTHGIHHDLRELSNGDFMATSNNIDLFQWGTREDVVLIVDRETGEVSREYNFREILDETREMYHHFDPAIKNAPNKDWMHINAALVDEEHNAIIVSSPTQSQVVSIDADTEQINWILGPHEKYEGSSAFLQEFLLQPIGEGFEWQWAQHQPMLLPDFDENPDTIDILLFDNGQSKSSEKATAVAPEDNYSRGVQYRINTVEMTVEQIWQFGKECGSTCYATFLGDANYYETTGNRIMTFGGQLRINGEPTDEIIAGVFGEGQTISRVIEVTEAGQVVFEVAVTPGENDNSGETYQAKRMQLYYDSAYDYSLGEISAQRLGQIVTDKQEMELLPPKLFLNKISVTFNEIYIKDNRLVMDGVIGFVDGPANMGRAYIGLISKDETFGFTVRPGLGGRFFTTIALSDLPTGEYMITAYGGVTHDNDAQTTDMTMGHIKTGYKVTIDHD